MFIVLLFHPCYKNNWTHTACSYQMWRKEDMFWLIMFVTLTVMLTLGCFFFSKYTNKWQSRDALHPMTLRYSSPRQNKINPYYWDISFWHTLKHVICRPKVRKQINLVHKKLIQYCGYTLSLEKQLWFLCDMNYFGIVSVRGEPMFMCNPWPRIDLIYIPSSVYTSICLILIKIKSIPNLLPTKLRPHEPGKCWLPTNIGPHE